MFTLNKYMNHNLIDAFPLGKCRLNWLYMLTPDAFTADDVDDDMLSNQSANARARMVKENSFILSANFEWLFLAL